MELKLSTLGVAAIAAAVALSGAACSKDSSSKSTSSPSSSSSSATTSSSKAETSSAAAAATDYAALLITPEDIVIPNDSFVAEPPQLNPGGSEGVAAGFHNTDGQRTIGDTIMVLPDPESAKTAMDGAVQALDQSIANPAPEPVAVGDDGVFAAGESPDGSQAVTVVTFTQGNGFVVMQFNGPPGDAADKDFAVALAQKQAENLKTGLG
ncbi:MAG: hypothetical protein U0Q47_04180 [Mycobacterium sp.]